MYFVLRVLQVRKRELERPVLYGGYSLHRDVQFVYAHVPGGARGRGIGRSEGNFLFLLINQNRFDPLTGTRCALAVYLPAQDGRALASQFHREGAIADSQRVRCFSFPWLRRAFI